MARVAPPSAAQAGIRDRPALAANVALGGLLPREANLICEAAAQHRQDGPHLPRDRYLGNFITLSVTVTVRALQSMSCHYRATTERAL